MKVGFAPHLGSAEIYIISSYLVALGMAPRVGNFTKRAEIRIRSGHHDGVTDWTVRLELLPVDLSAGVCACVHPRVARSSDHYHHHQGIKLLGCMYRFLVYWYLPATQKQTQTQKQTRAPTPLSASGTKPSAVSRLNVRAYGRARMNERTNAKCMPNPTQTKPPTTPHLTAAAASVTRNRRHARARTHTHTGHATNTTRGVRPHDGPQLPSVVVLRFVVSQVFLNLTCSSRSQYAII
ncbi:hypothetical protein BC827DRAFT_944522 [Russula dissimulans]|nr:hypothetical protein BC827DRAFT_944522 [Russula dissimulans]